MHPDHQGMEVSGSGEDAAHRRYTQRYPEGGGLRAGNRRWPTLGYTGNHPLLDVEFNHSGA